MLKIILDDRQLALKAKLELLGEQLNNPRNSLLSFFSKPPAPRGLYIYGQVGRGKTMLMDAFYQNVKKTSKTRVHFHKFMQSVHEMLASQPIDLVAKSLAQKTKLFCFDEFQVSDIADAMILGRLFTQMFQQGITLVTTSNQPPDNLYANGLHRDRFLPFIELLSSKVEICELDNGIDYRRKILSTHHQYFINDTSEIADIFKELANEVPPTPAVLQVKGHDLLIPRQANGVAWFNFAQICQQNYGAGDYLKLAESYHSIIISQVPIFSPQMHNEAKRFITLIDVLYDQGKNLIIQAAAKPDLLYNQGQNSDFFKRTASRLIEMTGG